MIERSADWLMLMAVVIFIDVVGRGVFNSPLDGTHEIIGNSVVAILFLQLPYALVHRGMLRTTIIYLGVRDKIKRVIDGLSYGLGIVLFVAIAWGGWGDMIIGWDILEFEGEGALEFPVYLIRTLIVFFGSVSALACALMVARAVLNNDPTADFHKGAPGGGS